MAIKKEHKEVNEEEQLDKVMSIIMYSIFIIITLGLIIVGAAKFIPIVIFLAIVYHEAIKYDCDNNPNDSH
jgi:hypothetical protein